MLGPMANLASGYNLFIACASICAEVCLNTSLPSTSSNLNSEDLLISEIMTLCPKKIEILDKSNSKKSRETIEIVSLLFEGKVTVIYSN